jgi:fructose-bisphosphate aldolase class II
MKTLKRIIQEAEQNKVAVGHFNISECVGLKGVFSAAKELNLPIIIGVSEGEAGFIGVKRAALMVKSLREEYDYPIFINADHAESFEKIKEAVEAGFDAVMFDGSKFPLEENIQKTKEVVEYVKSVNPEILVEAELGYLKGSSTLLAEAIIIKEEDLTKSEEAAAFVKETGVDLLAPSVGNLHGMFKNAPNPDLNIERIKEIRNAAGIPLVLHGGSGIKDEDFLAAIDSGISVIHINTELRLAWRRGMEKVLRGKPGETVPYKLLPEVVEEIKKVVYNRLKLFNKIN